MRTSAALTPASTKLPNAPDSKALRWTPKSRLDLSHTTLAERSRLAVDGEAFLHSAIADIRVRRANGEKVRAVFDIDDTLSDGAPRTFQIAKDWDQANRTTHFSRLTLKHVGSTGLETARTLKLPRRAAEAFHQHWETEFWKPERFVHDAPIKHVVQHARAAHDAGAEVIFLTGRIDELKDASIQQLKRFGLDFADEQAVVTKGSTQIRTAPFKTLWLQWSAGAGHHLAFFITESRRDIADLQQGMPGARAVLLESKVGGTEPIDPQTPVYRAPRR